MKKKYDSEKIKDALLAQVERVACHLLPHGKRDGKEWRCGDVRGSAGQSLALCLEGEKAGVWSDFATDERGDLLALWQIVRMCSFPEALEEAAAFVGVLDQHDPLPVTPATTKQPTKQEKVYPAPPEGVDGVTRFTYTDSNKQAVIYVQRIESNEGKKRFVQWGKSADGNGWVASLRHTPKPRPLYRLRSVLDAAGVVCLHEGEKSVVEACRAGLPFCHSSTIGGAGNARHSDFTPLKGKRVVIVPDHDEAGEKHRQQVEELATAAGASVVAVLRLPDLPDKGDVVEWLAAGGSPNQWRELVQAALEAAQPTPQPLPEPLRPVLPFSLAWLPWCFRQFVGDVSERMQCPPDFSAVVLMVAAGSIIGRRCVVYPKRLDSWQVSPNLWGALIGRPSLMKSPSLQAALKPMDSLIKEEAAAFVGKLAQMEHDGAIYAARVKAWKAELVRTLKAGGSIEAIKPPEKPAMHTERRYKTNESSVECMISLLNQNPDGLLLLRDELVGWLRGLDKAGREGARQFFLEAWNGNGGGFDYDTFSHGHMHCESLCLSVLGTIQPGLLADMVKRGGAGGSGDDGLLQRFQMMAYPDAPKQWQNIDRRPDHEAEGRIVRVFKRLSGELPPAMRFDEGAQVIFDQWRERLEISLQNEENPTIEAHLAKYRSLMPSLALIIHLVNIAERYEAEAGADLGGVVQPINEQATIMAGQWCEYLESHARRIYGMGEHEEVDRARQLLDKVRKQSLRAFTCREIVRKGWAGLSTTAQVKTAIDVASFYGWLEAKDVGGAGRPSVVYHLHQPKT